MTDLTVDMRHEAHHSTTSESSITYHRHESDLQSMTDIENMMRRRY